MILGYRWIALLFSLGLACIQTAPLVAGGYRDNTQLKTTGVLLMIQSTAAVRCQLVLAHFVTQTLFAGHNDGDTVLHLKRDDSTGSLSEKTSGRAMQLENILCGLNHDWQDTAVELPLSKVRSSSARRFKGFCAFDGNLRCTIETVPASQDH